MAELGENEWAVRSVEATMTDSGKVIDEVTGSTVLSTSLEFPVCRPGELGPGPGVTQRPTSLRLARAFSLRHVVGMGMSEERVGSISFGRGRVSG